MKSKYYFSFEIDCAPGALRPNIYAKSIFEHIGVDEFEAQSKLFGAWQWFDRCI